VVLGMPARTKRPRENKEPCRRTKPATKRG
ncbi:hypothetical protein V3C99_016247, partial [Haemonchus contortus]